MQTNSQQIHVVAAVIRDVRGRVLLARRTAGRDLAGAWEFPGGKVDAGETPLQALDRELHEELGIRVVKAIPLISVPQNYPSKRIVLDVYELDEYQGTPRGLEKQALMWSPQEKLHSYPMPPADRPVVAALQQTPSYWITPENLASATLFSKIQDAIKRGAQHIQLRAHHLPEKEYAELARKILSHARKYKAEVFLNAPVSLCADLKSSLHLSSARLMQVNKRPLPNTQRIIASCHNQEELEHAQRIGVDMAVLGSVQSTATHADAKPMGWDKFAELRATVSIPIYALGGLSMNDLAQARQHGAQGIAGIRGFFA